MALFQFLLETSLPTIDILLHSVECRDDGSAGQCPFSVNFARFYGNYALKWKMKAPSVIYEASNNFCSPCLRKVRKCFMGPLTTVTIWTCWQILLMVNKQHK